MPTGKDPSAGYAMVALLVALAVMSVAVTAAMPVWRTAAQREREAELIFRGEQYVRAIALFERRAGPGARPPDIDFLVENRFLRKAYADPMTGGAFQVLRQGGAGGPARAGVQPGIIGVVSTSEAPSIRLYKDQDAYNEWLFVHEPPAGPPDGRGDGRTGDARPRSNGRE